MNRPSTEPMGSGLRFGITSLLVLLLTGSMLERLRGGGGELPTEFYIVTQNSSDTNPFWSHDILAVRLEGRDSVVRCIRVAPMIGPGGRDCNCVTVRAVTVRLPGVSPSDLLSNSNPCTVDSRTLTRKIQRAAQRTAITDTSRFGIVANCGSKQVVLHFPDAQNVNLGGGLREKSAELARWWDVQDIVKERAFGRKDIFRDISDDYDDEKDHRLQLDGGLVVPELLGGRFDDGLQSNCPPGGHCAPPTFRQDLREYIGPVYYRGLTPRLIEPDQHLFSRYVAPKYPPLALRAGISGLVKLDLSGDRTSGVVRQFKVVSGHPLLLEGLTEAAKQWRMMPEQGDGERQLTGVDIVFEIRCPEKLAK